MPVRAEKRSAVVAERTENANNNHSNNNSNNNNANAAEPGVWWPSCWRGFGLLTHGEERHKNKKNNNNKNNNDKNNNNNNNHNKNNKNKNNNNNSNNSNNKQRSAEAYGGRGVGVSKELDWMEELQLPMRRNTLDPHAMVAELPEAARSRLVDHFAASVSFSPELKAVAEHILQHAPRLLRAKELLETVEAFKQIANFAADASKARGGVPLARAYDVACGHGLLGCLLAYRFPKAKITCCDTAPMRPALQAYIAAFEACGIRSFEGEAVLGNLEFVQGELAKVVRERELEADSSQLAMVAAVHACNSAAPEAIAAAEAAGAVWCVMPCCIPDGTYFPCAIRGSASGDDTVRYLLQCGAIAGQHRAERVNAIDSRITNRNFLLCGGAGWADNEERKLSCTGPSPQPSGKK